MLKSLHLKNVGPSKELDIQFGSRLNVLTGDNGLGKSFLLDIAWWALTRKWPAEVNDGLTSGFAARPRGDGEASIEFELLGKTGPASYQAQFIRQEQAWVGNPGRPAMPGLVIYAQVDGGYSVWDPARNYWKRQGSMDVQDRLPAYVFSPRDVWDGLEFKDRGRVCNGLIADLASWQREKNEAFRGIEAVLRELSGGEEDKLELGELTRIGLEDARDIPTIKTGYGVEVPILFASAAIKRIVALAYLLVWTMREHVIACRVTGSEPASRIILLVDEIECHLHPRWQRLIAPALLRSFDPLIWDVQVIAATHSPLVLASLEPLFDVSKDSWHDLDLNRESGEVILTPRSFERLGDASSWLESEAFDLKQSGSVSRERAIENLGQLLEEAEPNWDQIEELGKELERVISDKDPVWSQWRWLKEKRGLSR